MDTQKINSNQPKDKSDKKQKNGMAEQFGVAATAAGLSSAGTVFAQEILKEEDTPTDEPVTPVEDNTSDENTEDIVNSEDIIVSEGVEDEVVEVIEEPQPITEDDIPVTSDMTDGNDEPSSEQTEDHVSEDTVDPVNPDEVAEAILSGEQVDPNDVEMADVVNFDEIGTVYTVDGESYTAATFHDPSGEEMVMVDVDDDDVFDLVTTTDGTVVGEANGMTVGDAEIMIDDDPTYLAQSDTTDDEDLVNGEDYMNDVILS